MKTSELSGVALDWAVAKCEGKEAARVQGLGDAVRLFRTVGYDPTPWQPSTDWAQGGPIIERENVSLVQQSHEQGLWWAFYSGRHDLGEHKHIQYATTPLIAAMRCYVASKLGDDIEIPKELT